MVGNFKYPSTIRAEVLVNYILQYPQHNVGGLQISYEGNFRRNFSEDIAHYELNRKDPNDELLILKLNRNSIYDKLPEGLFHELDRFVKLGSGGSKTTFKEEYEKQKNEIEYSRKFFQPFDSLFFNLSLKLERAFSDNTIDARKSIYKMFFSDDSKIDVAEKFISRILTFIPHFPKIKANSNYLKLFLTYLLDSEINIQQNEFLLTQDVSSAVSNNILNESYLGKSFYLGNKYIDIVLQWNIDIKASNKSIQSFIEDIEYDKLINFIISYLIPAGITTTFIINSIEYHQITLQNDTLNDKRQYLGYNITI